jgi:amino acid transporter
MIFVFLAFGRFEPSAALAEEAQNPCRTVPRAILLATICIGLLYLFCSYAGIVGWGPSNITAYAEDATPWGTMAKRVWGPLEFVVVIAILNTAWHALTPMSTQLHVHFTQWEERERCPQPLRISIVSKCPILQFSSR